jgi:hypothetical protein
LELPLSRKHLSVDARDLHARIDAGLIVSLHDVSAVYLSGTNTTVVRPLGTGETTLWPTIGLVVLIKQSVLLFKTKPWLMVFVSVHQAGTLMSVVELVGGTIRVPAFRKDKDVWRTTERIREDGTWAQVDVRVISRRLASRGPIKVPFG